MAYRGARFGGRRGRPCPPDTSDRGFLLRAAFVDCWLKVSGVLCVEVVGASGTSPVVASSSQWLRRNRFISIYLAILGRGDISADSSHRTVGREVSYMAMRQLSLSLMVRTWGGARRGAGRKPGPRRLVSHAPRPALLARHPVHVTLRVARDIPSLRVKERFRILRGAFRAALGRADFRVVHYSVQADHLHLLVEADDCLALSRGMAGLQIRIARALNRHLSRRGKVFTDRYHARILKTPTEVRNALAYVLNNFRKHAKEHGAKLARGWLDPFSSSSCFAGWLGVHPYGQPSDVGVATGRTWLLAAGWKRIGLIRTDQCPGRA